MMSRCGRLASDASCWPSCQECPTFRNKVLTSRASPEAQGSLRRASWESREKKLNLSATPRVNSKNSLMERTPEGWTLSFSPKPVHLLRGDYTPPSEARP